jgi:parallel beta-helix repeat protein
MQTLLSISMLTLAFNIQRVEASGTIYIRADGSIDPPSANITTSDYITYTFTGNNSDSIVVQRSDIVIDGAGYTVQGSGTGNGFGLSGIDNVTVKNTNIRGFGYSIVLYGSSNCSIVGNNINNSWYGIQLWGLSSNNTVSGNTIAGSWIGAYFESAHNNTVSGNEFVGDGLVVNGAYRNVVVDNTVNGKPLVYLEDASSHAVVDAGQVVLVNCDHIQVQNLNLSYTTIGVELWNTNNTLISDNNLTRDGEYGVFLTHSCSYNTISENNITLGDMSINQAGILLEYSCSYNTISKNKVTASIGMGSGVGLVNSCEHNSISGNVFVGVGLLLQSLNVVVDNTVNGKPLVYLENASDQAVTDAGQVILISCDHIQVQNLNLSRATMGLGLWNTNHTLISGNIMTDEVYGIALTYSFNNTISENTVTNNAYGITLNAFSNYNDVSGNNVNDTISSPYVGTSPHGGILLISSCNYNGISGNMIANRRYGIIFSSSCNYNDVSGNRITKGTYGIYLLSSCSSNTVSGNSVTNNAYGIFVSSSSNNIIYHNNFVDNTNQAYISGASTNVWDDGYPSGGNYWSNYAGLDEKSGPNQDQPGSDGIGDSPRVIDANNKDNYPLMNNYIVGDTNHDGIVNNLDLLALALAYGSVPGSLNWNVRADLNDDHIVNVVDLFNLAKNYGKTGP